MKIIVFNGSPRAERGNTHTMVEAFLRGATEAGAEVENIFLVRKNIKHCLGCFACWTKTPGECIQKDDMTDLLQKWQASDIVVFATPLYVDNVTGIMKNFMDRMIPLADPHFAPDSKGECVHPKRSKKSQKYVVIANCGFPEQGQFEVLKHLFKRLSRNAQSELIAEIYRGEGELLRNPPLILKPLIWKYKRLLKRAGREVATDQKLSEETIRELEKPLISYERYTEGANKHWDKILETRTTDIKI